MPAVYLPQRSSLCITESWLLAKLHLKRLDDLLYARAEMVIRRLGDLARERGNKAS